MVVGKPTSNYLFVIELYAASLWNNLHQSMDSWAGYINVIFILRSYIDVSYGSSGPATPKHPSRMIPTRCELSQACGLDIARG
jgi:hypothetical protein